MLPEALLNGFPGSGCITELIKKKVVCMCVNMYQLILIKVEIH